VLVLALSAAACGTGGDGGSDGGAGGDQKDRKQAAPARPVPVESGKRAVTWTDLQHRSHELLAAPSELARGSVADLENVRLDPKLKGLVPYYLTVSYTNKGKAKLERPAPERDFLIASADGQPGKPISVFSSALSQNSGLPKACSKGAPQSLKPGGTATVCQIFMMSPDLAPAAVSHIGRDADGDETDPVIWKAGRSASGSGKDELPAEILPLKKSARSAVQDTKQRNVKVEAAAQSIRRGKVADLSRFKLSPDEKGQVPYYVTVRYRNAGSHELLPQMNQKTELRAVSGRSARRLNLIDFSGGGLAQCPDAKPDSLVKPKASVTECSVFMLPRTDSPASLVFTGEGSAAKTVTWRVPGAD
jgi:hypothetical protein